MRLLLYKIIAIYAGCLSLHSLWSVETHNAVCNDTITKIRLEHRGVERTASLYCPAFSRPVPLVVYLHGSAGNASAAIKSSRMIEVARLENFAVVFPEATKPNMSEPDAVNNARTWNDGSGRAHSGRDNTDDTGFLLKLTDTVRVMIDVDHTRIYYVGFSNGAAMSMRASIELFPMVAGVGAVAGHLFLPAGQYSVSTSVPLVYFAGELDLVAPPQGGAMVTPYGERAVNPPAFTTLHNWAIINRCVLRKSVVEETDHYTLFRAAECDYKREVLYYLVNQNGHVWPGGVSLSKESHVGPLNESVNASLIIWNFLKKYQN